MEQLRERLINAPEYDETHNQRRYYTDGFRRSLEMLRDKYIAAVINPQIANGGEFTYYLLPSDISVVKLWSTYVPTDETPAKYQVSIYEALKGNEFFKAKVSNQYVVTGEINGIEQGREGKISGEKLRVVRMALVSAVPIDKPIFNTYLTGSLDERFL